MTRKRRTIITIILSLIECIIYFSLYDYFINIETVISFLTQIVPVGILFGINYYILSPFLYFVCSKLWQLTGHYKYVSKQFNDIAQKCVAWLIDLEHNWGVIDSAPECQNANTCEGLLALKKTGLSNRYNYVYTDAFNRVINELTDKGLTSKSLHSETVVCTSMILYLFALEKKSSNQFDGYEDKFNAIAQNLWSVRSEAGWGVFLEKSNVNNSSIASSFWALLALNEYENIAHSQDYYDMVRRIFEYSNDSIFGYSRGDSSRLWPTAMSVVLYYSVDNILRCNLNEVYNIRQAVNYIYKQFCLEGTEIETETLSGIEEKCDGAKKAPWTHISIGMVLEALIMAFKNKSISILKMDLVVERVKKICKTNLVYIDDNRTKCYYVPHNMQKKANGVYTFPTAYLAWGLSRFDFYERGKKDGRCKQIFALNSTHN